MRRRLVDTVHLTDIEDLGIPATVSINGYALAAELERVLEIVRSEDSAEGIRALLDKRPPRWVK